MKKVLIIAFHFPPATNIGAMRPYGLSKYLPLFGWEPVVLTVKASCPRDCSARVIETEYDDVAGRVKASLGFDPRAGLHEQFNIDLPKNFAYSSWRSRAIKLAREIVTFPDEKKGWYGYALRAAVRTLKAEKIDAIISTSSPVISHLIAGRLKDEFGMPWVADLRDLWTQNHYCDRPRLLRTMERKLEKRTLAKADALVTVSEPMADALRTLHGRTPVHCVMNGYDEEDGADAPVPLDPLFTITYTGTLYNGKRDPSLLFSALTRLFDAGRLDRKKVRVCFLGKPESWLEEEVRERGLGDVVDIRGQVPRKEAMASQQASHLLLLLLWNHEQEAGVYTAKIFEYLRARRPIIAIGGKNGVVAEILRDTGAGRLAESERELSGIIADYYDEYVRYGAPRFAGNELCRKFTFRAAAGNYASILDGLTAGDQAGRDEGALSVSGTPRAIG